MDMEPNTEITHSSVVLSTTQTPSVSSIPSSSMKMKYFESSATNELNIENQEACRSFASELVRNPDGM